MSFQYELDDDSDLTELSDDEEETPLSIQYPASKPAAAKTKAAQTKKAAKDINPPRLKECYHKTWSPDNLYRNLQLGVINLNPEYQRDVVWTDTHQGYLIDSLMHNYAVFPLIFAVRPNEHGVEERICIDGKQRITAIQQFMDGKISYRDSQLNREMWYKSVPQAKTPKNVISAAQKQRFDLMNIVVYEYMNITEHEEREIFQRVQNAVALTAHERLKAYNGPNADLVRDMHRTTSSALREFLAWDKAKGKDFFMLAQIAILINHHLSARKGAYPATELKLSRVETFLHSKTAPSPKLRASALGVVDTMNCLIRDERWRNPFEAIQPMWFVMTGFMIYLYREKRSLAQLADAVRQMKEIVKAKTAAKAYKDLAAFVVNKVPVLKLTSDGIGDTPAAYVTFDGRPVALPHLPRPPLPMASASAPPKISPKRKKSARVSDAESEEEVDEAPKKKAMSARRNKRCLPESDDEDDDYEVPSAPLRMKTAAARTAVKKIASATKGGTPAGSAPVSKATTTVKRSTSKPSAPAATTKTSARASTSASARESPMASQVGKPSIKPSKTKKLVTSCASPSSSAQATPTTSRSPMPPPLPSASTSAPLLPSRPRPLNPSRTSTPVLVSARPSPIDRITAETRPSPSISPVNVNATLPPSKLQTQTPLHYSDRHAPPDRLAPIRAAKARLAGDNPQQQQQQLLSPSVSTSASLSSMSMSISSSSSAAGTWQHHHQQQQHQPSVDPRRRPPSANPTPQPAPPVSANDEDEEFLAQLAAIESTLGSKPSLLTPAPSKSPTPTGAGTTTASVVVPPLPQQRPQSRAETDVVMADGTKDVLSNVQPIGRRPPVVRPLSAGGPAPPSVPLPQINTNVDEYRNVPSTSASAQPSRQSTSTSSVTAQQAMSAPLPGSGLGSNGSFSVKGMPPISKLPPQPQPQPQHVRAPTIPASRRPGASGSLRETDAGRVYRDRDRESDRESVYSRDSRDDERYRRQRPEYSRS
ncbi:hypothetical protein LshimejAT787_1202890 [Lyophyllum shimeji]|uniref:GmrSD restriction endonucleases N-terminal domain-containing protein n=1 Tax=Lyophyllum shimeji TaxID=47721 RepID=A0A9P3PTZ5_LYOSH|nr:hypothetical protein LshimejAT787_1202890 [Lyophyllum shimeji]